jgi:1-acyl-sn-glycerol-3-phosphate acyltransferase
MISGAGIFYVSNSRPQVCYKKYLGPNWEPDYDWKRCGSVVCNHTSFLDIMTHALSQLPCMIAKKEVKNIPSVGPIAIAS